MRELGIYSRLDQVFDAPFAVKEVLTSQFSLDRSVCSRAFSMILICVCVCVLEVVIKKDTLAASKVMKLVLKFLVSCGNLISSSVVIHFFISI